MTSQSRSKKGGKDGLTSSIVKLDWLDYLVSKLKGLGKDGKDGFETEIKSFGKCFGTQDFKEGTTAFLEKRKAQFTGK